MKASRAGGQLRENNLLYQHNVPDKDVSDHRGYGRQSSNISSGRSILHASLSDWHELVFQELNKKIEDDVLEGIRE